MTEIQQSNWLVSVDHAVENHSLKTIDIDLYHEPLSFDTKKYFDTLKKILETLSLVSYFSTLCVKTFLRCLVVSGFSLILISHFGQYSKPVSNLKYSYLNQMTTKNKTQNNKIEVGLFIIQKYFIFESSSFVVHFMLDQIGGHPV